MMEISRSAIAGAELIGPEVTEKGDVFRSPGHFEILLGERDGLPFVELRSPGGEILRVVGDHDKEPLDEVEVDRMLWERLEEFDHVIERLAGSRAIPWPS